MKKNSNQPPQNGYTPLNVKEKGNKPKQKNEPKEGPSAKMPKAKSKNPGY